MIALQKQPAIPAEVVSDSSVMDGVPVVRGTRVPAETILAYLRDRFLVDECLSVRFYCMAACTSANFHSPAKPGASSESGQPRTHDPQ